MADIDDLNILIKSLTLAESKKDLFIGYLSDIAVNIKENFHQLPRNQALIRDFLPNGKLVPVATSQKVSPWILLRSAIFQHETVKYPVWICQRCSYPCET